MTPRPRTMWCGQQNTSLDIPCQVLCTSQAFLPLFPNSLACLHWNTTERNTLFQNKVSCNDTQGRLFGLYHHTNNVQIMYKYLQTQCIILCFFSKLRTQILPLVIIKVFKKKRLSVLWLFGPTSPAKSEISSLNLEIAFELNTCCSKRKFGLVLSPDLRSRRDEMF